MIAFICGVLAFLWVIRISLSFYCSLSAFYFNFFLITGYSKFLPLMSCESLTPPLFPISPKYLAAIFLKSWHYGNKFLTWPQHHIYSRQAAVALSININCITPCASEDYPSGYQVFRTASIKAFISWVKAGWLLFWPKIESNKKSISKHADYCFTWWFIWH